MSLTRYDTWGTFYARERLAPMAARAADHLDSSTRDAVDAVIDRCEAGGFDDDDQPARLHGDLWSGNVMWTADGVVLIDPAAHGGHRETDLAMLALFGCPHFDAVIEGYESERRLRVGWRDRIGLHQLYPLLAHVVLFGGSYAAPDPGGGPCRAGRVALVERQPGSAAHARGNRTTPDGCRSCRPATPAPDHMPPVSRRNTIAEEPPPSSSTAVSLPRPRNRSWI